MTAEMRKGEPFEYSTSGKVAVMALVIAGLALMFAGQTLWGALLAAVVMAVVSTREQVRVNARRRRAVERLRRRAPDLTPRQRSAEFRDVAERYGSAAPSIRALGEELERLPGGTVEPPEEADES